MRITKRSSGGRGEYEISEPFGPTTPRDLLNHTLVLDLGEGLQIPTGVVLLDRNGKRRLRIDPSSGAQIHLHRQLAAALLMPYPARGETAWGTGEPVMESDSYGIGYIDLSHIELNQRIAIILPKRLEIANRDRHASISCSERLQQVRLLWERRESLPPGIAALLARHEHETARERPLGTASEIIVADLQRAAAGHARSLGLAARETADAVPFLVSLAEGPPRSPSVPVASAVVVRPAVDNVQSQVPGRQPTPVDDPAGRAWPTTPTKPSWRSQ